MNAVRLQLNIKTINYIKIWLQTIINWTCQINMFSNDIVDIWPDVSSL